MVLTNKILFLFFIFSLNFQSPPVIAMSAYKDVSGLLTHKLETINLTSGNDFTGYMKPEPNMKIEDEEDLLYGESGNAFKVTSVSGKHKFFYSIPRIRCNSISFRSSIWRFH